MKSSFNHRKFSLLGALVVGMYLLWNAFSWTTGTDVWKAFRQEKVKVESVLRNRGIDHQGDVDFVRSGRREVAVTVPVVSPCFLAVVQQYNKWVSTQWRSVRMANRPITFFMYRTIPKHLAVEEPSHFFC